MSKLRLVRSSFASYWLCSNLMKRAVSFGAFWISEMLINEYGTVQLFLYIIEMKKWGMQKLSNLPQTIQRIN